MPFPPTPTRRPTYPMAHAARQKPRRIPLVLRFYKGAIHNIIILPVLLHCLFAALVVYLNRHVTGSISLPSTIIPSLSIVVGLMLVFRNSTSYDRFWTGRNCLTTIGTSVRNLGRSFLVNSRDKDGKELTDAEKRDTEKIIRVLIAVLYAIKHNLRAEFNIPPASLMESTPPTPTSTRRPGLSRANSILIENGITTAKAEYISLLPDGIMGYEDQGLGLPLQLTVLVEGYIRRGFHRGWFHGPQASQLTVQVNALVDAYGRMETIRSTPIPVAHLYVPAFPFSCTSSLRTQYPPETSPSPLHLRAPLRHRRRIRMVGDSDRGHRRFHALRNRRYRRRAGRSIWLRQERHQDGWHHRRHEMRDDGAARGVEEREERGHV
jgi:putative membrane protein